MRFISTRTSADTQTTTPSCSFRDVLFTGLAPDGGLYVPDSFNFSISTSANDDNDDGIQYGSEFRAIRSKFASLLEQWTSREDVPSYEEVCLEICSQFIEEDDIPRSELTKIINKSYKSFDHEVRAPLRRIGVKTPDKDLEFNFYMLELFHGKTLAFKDYALSLLGSLLEWYLEKEKADGKDGFCTILAATSGDTGSATISAMNGKQGIETFVLHPKDKLSKTQELQMTTIISDSVHNVAVADSTFDICQSMVKEMFKNHEFRTKHNLVAPNSINFVRIIAQIVYYVFAYIQYYFDLKTRKNLKYLKKVSFYVPTGNFGNVLACFYAKMLGLPIDRINISTNENDILDRFVKTGVYSELAGGVVQTPAPAMDIQISSNFERYLFHLFNNDARHTTHIMQEFEEKGKVKGHSSPRCVDLSSTDGYGEVYRHRDENGKKENEKKNGFLLHSMHVTSDEILHTIQHVFERTQRQYLLDPHSATAVFYAMQDYNDNHNNVKVGVGECEGEGDADVICVGTASFAKFSDVIREALALSSPSPSLPPIPPQLRSLEHIPPRVEVLPANTQRIMEYMESVLTFTLTKPTSDSVTPFSFSPFSIIVPGSTSNLGTGYDVLGVALSIFLRVSMVKIEEDTKCDNNNPYNMTFRGEGEVGKTIETNLMLKSAEYATQSVLGRSFPLFEESGLGMKVENDIPFGRGLGSSGAAVVAGVLLANTMFNLNLSKSEVIDLSMNIECNPDNIVASVNGGCVGCYTEYQHELEAGQQQKTGNEGEGELKIEGTFPKAKAPKFKHVRIPLDDRLAFLVVVPDFQLSTMLSRSVLPATHRHEVAIVGVQRLGALCIALNNVEEYGADIKSMMRDVFHQQYRAHLVPGLEKALDIPFTHPHSRTKEKNMDMGLLGVSLSGAGPSVVALLDKKSGGDGSGCDFTKVGEMICECFEELDIRAKYYVLDVVRDGGHVYRPYS